MMRGASRAAPAFSVVYARQPSYDAAVYQAPVYAGPVGWMGAGVLSGLVAAAALLRPKAQSFANVALLAVDERPSPPSHKTTFTDRNWSSSRVRPYYLRDAWRLLPTRKLQLLHPPSSGLGRRRFLAATGALAGLGIQEHWPATAFVAGEDQEVSGLVVLRVAEVCNFQEKLLRAIAACSNPKYADQADQFGNSYCSEAYSVSPGQIMFGTGVMLRNANLDGNLKLMISQEVPKKNKDKAINGAVEIMNTFNRLVSTAGEYQEFKDGKDLLIIADIYKDARQQLARFFDYLPVDAKNRFYNYAEDVRKYEEKVASEDGIERMKT